MDANNNMDMHNASCRIDAANNSIIAKNTLIADKQYRAPWNAWCQAKQFHDLNTVHENKVWLYVEENLVATAIDGSLKPRLSKVSKKGKGRVPIGVSVVSGHLAAIMKLYKEQALVQRTNSNPMLNKEKISKFKKAVKRLQITSIIVNFEDRGIGSIFDGYCNQDELKRLSSIALEDGSLSSFRTRVS